jgi:hypothetical protein
VDLNRGFFTTLASTICSSRRSLTASRRVGGAFHPQEGRRTAPVPGNAQGGVESCRGLGQLGDVAA